MAAQEFSGFWIYGYELAVAPDTGFFFIGHGIAIDGVAHGFEFFGGSSRGLLTDDED